MLFYVIYDMKRPYALNTFDNDIELINEYSRLVFTNKFNDIFNSERNRTIKAKMKKLKRVLFDGHNGPLWTRAFEPYKMLGDRQYLRELKLKYGRELIEYGMEDEERKDKVVRPLVETYVCDDLMKTLDILGIKRMVKGHDPQWSYKIAIHCDKKMWIIDVGISKVYQGGHLGAIEIDLVNDNVEVIVDQGQTYTKNKPKKRE